ncbi:MULTISPECIES: 3-hydroxyacyl-CoA dehydrogenase NAD-binding domain-containing protein [Roseobacteraceae]|nr:MULTISPECIES: 3-hydroxyacyl-CoA dehydrogenase NAD-binding domain-containing protein [Roseobacteraceae]
MNDLSHDRPPLLSVETDGDIAVVRLDNPPVSATSDAVRAGLIDVVTRLDADDTVRAVVLSCAGRTFIAGGDMKEFDRPPQEPHLPDVVARIETAAKPWIAAIHGSALGGGLEIAMGCRFRVAQAGARFGLPEVTLGLIPGASGTVRTPRLTGMDLALRMATTGSPITATEALEAGLIDAVTGEDLVADAVGFARAALTRPLPPVTSERPLSPLPNGFWAEARAALPRLGHDAPLHAVESLRFASERPLTEALRHERKTFLALRSGATSCALRHVFLAERAAPRPARLKQITPRPLDRIGVIGGGTMGAGIAAACLLAGSNVILIERNAEAVEQGMQRIDDILSGAVTRGKLTPDGYDFAIASLKANTDYARLKDRDLVIEAVFEDLAVKREVFLTLSEVCGPRTVLATNTSYLDPREIVADLPHPERFIGLHFFSPAHVMKLLEIVPLPDTAQEVLATGFALGRKLNKIPVETGICEGFIGNRILKRYRAEAESLVTQGIAIPEIDAAMRDYGFRMGPFEAQDMGGLDIAFLQREGARAAGQAVPETLGDILVRAGRKGQKTRAGWYDYDKGARRPLPSTTVEALLAKQITGSRSMTRDAIATHLVATMSGEGEAILKEGVARSPADIDLVKVHGYGFPRWKGGPMHASRKQEGVSEYEEA